MNVTLAIDVCVQCGEDVRLCACIGMDPFCEQKDLYLLIPVSSLPSHLAVSKDFGGKAKVSTRMRLRKLAVGSACTHTRTRAHTHTHTHAQYVAHILYSIEH
jgi:hypothetical protein